MMLALAVERLIGNGNSNGPSSRSSSPADGNGEPGPKVSVKVNGLVSRLHNHNHNHGHSNRPGPNTKKMDFSHRITDLSVPKCKSGLSLHNNNNDTDQDGRNSTETETNKISYHPMSPPHSHSPRSPPNGSSSEEDEDVDVLDDDAPPVKIENEDPHVENETKLIHSPEKSQDRHGTERKRRRSSGSSSASQTSAEDHRTHRPQKMKTESDDESQQREVSPRLIDASVTTIRVVGDDTSGVRSQQQPAFGICDTKPSAGAPLSLSLSLSPPSRSRPPSTASEMSAASSSSSSSSCGSYYQFNTHNNASIVNNGLHNNNNHTSLMMITQPNHRDPHNSLKFSIDHILRPEFGAKAIEKIQFPLSARKGSSTAAGSGHRNRGQGNPRGGQTPQNRSTNKNSGPVNAHHSEDSNHSIGSSGQKSLVTNGGTPSAASTSGGGGGSRAAKEIVDDSKVNPPVPKGPLLWPAWVYCTRYSDRPSSGPRSRRVKRPSETGGGGGGGGGGGSVGSEEEKRPRTAFTGDQLARLKREFDENRYLTEKRRQDLARDLKLHENQIKIWFQNKRAKLKKSNGQRGGLALQLMAQGLYNHSTIPMDEDEEDYLPCP